MPEKLKLKAGGEETYIKGEKKNPPLHCSQVGDWVSRLVFVVISTTSTPKSSRYWNLYFRENCWVITALGKCARVVENRGHPRERWTAVLWRTAPISIWSSLSVLPNGLSQWNEGQRCQNCVLMKSIVEGNRRRHMDWIKASALGLLSKCPALCVILIKSFLWRSHFIIWKDFLPPRVCPNHCWAWYSGGICLFLMFRVILKSHEISFPQRWRWKNIHTRPKMGRGDKARHQRPHARLQMWPQPPDITKSPNHCPNDS